MASHTLSPNLLLGLHRELRDMIYIHLLDFSTAWITGPPLSFSQLLPKCNSQVAAEILEAYFTHTTIQTAFSADEFPDLEKCWGPNTPVVLSNIRSLVVEAKEPLQTASTVREFESRRAINSGDRQMWATLLEMPSLKKLEVRMQKAYGDIFSWMPFAPVLYELRERKPQLVLEFKISFDNMLQRAADDPYWESFREFSSKRPYEPMGYVIINELFEKPSEEDWKYVEENFPLKEMPKDKSARDSMFRFSPQEKRELVLSYVVKEPALLRVQMWEGWQVWKEIEEKKKKREEEKIRHAL